MKSSVCSLLATAALLAAASSVAAASATPTMKATVHQSEFGKLPDGTVIHQFTLTNAKGVTAKVITYGAILTELDVPDRNGQSGDVVLGFDSFEPYIKNPAYFGALIGRYGNRIGHGQFKLEGASFNVPKNDGDNSLHGGIRGFDKQVWKARENGDSLEVTYLSKDGEEGYPGDVTASVTYALTNDNEFKIDMEATTDKTTIVNMAHHGYWNLGGFDSGSIADHELTLYADKYTPGDPVVANGVIKPVKGTPFDFTKSKPIGKDLAAVIIKGNPAPGYDHNFVVNGDPHALRPVAKVKEPKSGRVMSLEGDQPGVMFYAGLFLDGTITGKGHVYRRYDAFCMETQKFPNSINVPAWKNEVILKPGQKYKHVMIHRFTAE